MGNIPDRLAVIVARLGPYHVAKIGAVARVYGPEAVTAVEMASSDTTYSWDEVVAEGFRRVTLLTDCGYEDAPARRLSAEVVAALEREDPVAVGINGWGFPEARAALGWCRRRGRIAVLMSDSQEADAPRRPLKELVKRWIVAQCDSALVAGSSHAAYLQKLGMPKERIALGYDVVDNDHFARGAEQARADASARGRLGLPERYFLVSARFIEKKNLAGVMRAYARYRDLAGDEAWALVLLGDGPLRRQLEALKTDLGLAASVRFAGFKQYPEIPAYYGLASAFVLASTSEPWGLVVNEAMAAGLPVLVSERCGAAELVRDGENGWRFDPRDSERLGALMLRLTRLGGELDAFGRASRRIVADYGPDRFARGFLEAVELGREHSRRSSPSRVASWLLGA